MTDSRFATHPIWRLFVFRMKSLAREPGSLFWIFAFPVLTSLALGLSFDNRSLSEVSIAVADGPGAEGLTRDLDDAEGVRAARVPLERAREMLRVGQVALVVTSGERPEMYIDPTLPEARTARLLARDVLERRAGRTDRVDVAITSVREPGGRYIDFLIPGLLGMGLMTSSVITLGVALVQMRAGRLLKQMVSSPMRRSHFFIAMMLAHTVLALVEVVFFLAFSRALFGVRLFGSALELAAFGLVGSACFSALTLLVVSRVEAQEAANGLMNLVVLPMTALSGVFFTTSRFPAWMQWLAHGLPLSALNDGLRAIMLEGRSIGSLGSELTVLGVWGLVSFFLSLRLFRWS
jgi:ABC-2 type transport system permease protein